MTENRIDWIHYWSDGTVYFERTDGTSGWDKLTMPHATILCDRVERFIADGVGRVLLPIPGVADWDWVWTAGT